VFDNRSRSRNMAQRWLLIVLICSGVFGCTLHCIAFDAWLHARSVASDRPLNDPKEADPNESGCICRGALIVAPHALQDVCTQWCAVAWIHLFPLLQSPVVALDSRDTLRPTRASEIAPSSPAGRILRALLSSLLL